MSVDGADPMPRKRGGTPKPTLVAVPSEGFSTLAAIEMQTIIRYLEQVAKRADDRFLKVIPPEQLAELRAVAPRIRGFLDAADPQLGSAPPVAPRAVTGRRDLRKLSDDQVRAIRARHAAGVSQGALGREYGMVQTGISKIVRRETYRDVADD